MVSMDWLLRHRQTKVAATDRLIPNDVGYCPLLYLRFVIPVEMIERRILLIRGQYLT